MCDNTRATWKKVKLISNSYWKADNFFQDFPPPLPSSSQSLFPWYFLVFQDYDTQGCKLLYIVFHCSGMCIFSLYVWHKPIEDKGYTKVSIYSVFFFFLCFFFSCHIRSKLFSHSPSSAGQGKKIRLKKLRMKGREITHQLLSHQSKLNVGNEEEIMWGKRIINI